MEVPLAPFSCMLLLQVRAWSTGRLGKIKDPAGLREAALLPFGI